MSFLLDTNVVSESTRPRPDPGVTRWLDTVDEDGVFLSVITLAELRHGIERLPTGRKRTQLDAWLTDALVPRFEGRLLAVDAAVADRWGRLVAGAEMVGRPLPAVDAFVAATALVHGLVIVTRNVADFVRAGVDIINPWADAKS